MVVNLLGCLSGVPGRVSGLPGDSRGLLGEVQDHLDLGGWGWALKMELLGYLL